MLQELSKRKEMLQKLLLMIGAFLGTYGISYICSLAAGNHFSNGIFSVMVCIGLYVLLKMTWQNLQLLETGKEKRKRFGYAWVLAIFFCALMIAGYQLKINDITDPGFKGKGMILLRGVCMSFAVLPFTNYLFAWFEKMRDVRPDVGDTKHWTGKKVFFASWIGIFACWFPVFLAYYPAVMSYDFHRQSIEAVKGFIWFNSYQPLAHTWLIWLFLNVGKALDGYQTGMAVFSICQMLLFSATAAYSCNVVYRLTRKKAFIVGMVLFLGLFPFISIHSVSITKDIPFSALFLVFMSLFVERHFLCNGNARKEKIIDLLWVLDGVVMMLFRNNAIYAVAIFTVFYLILGAKKQRVRIFIMCLTLVVGGKGALEGIQLALGTEIRGSKVEMFSVPIQQFARVGHYHGHELDKEYYPLVYTYVPHEYWPIYYPPLSDAIKGGVGVYTFPYTWEGHYDEMLKAWFKVGLKYPNAYIDAFLALNAGYWFFDDVTWSEVLGSGLEGRMGALFTYTSSTSEVIPEGIAHESKFPALEGFLENIVSANCFYDWPVLSVLFKPALYCWALLISAIAAIYMKKRKKILVILLPLVYLATVFLGPVVQVRYVLPIIVIIPLMIAVLMTHKDIEAVETEEKEHAEMS